MQFMIIQKATKDSESGVPPTTDQIARMVNFHEELAKAGVLLDAQGLHPSSKGARIRISGKKRTVIDGPFTETKELVAGFWVIQVKSKEEAIEWFKRVPNVWPEDVEIEIRQVVGPEDFGPEMTPELVAQVEGLEAQRPAAR
jgi:hypothetical protein